MLTGALSILSAPLRSSWRAPAIVKRGDGRIEWQRFGDGVRLWLDDAVADTGHGIARGKLRMLVRPGEPPLMDLSATAEGVDVTQIWRYLQVGRMSPKSVRWLDAAFRAGRVTSAQVSITGPTRGFPYREGQGLFRARGRAEGVNLFYAPGWPELRGVDAEFILRDAGQDKEALPGILAEARAEAVDLILSWGTTVTLGIGGTLSQLDDPAHNHDIPEIFMIVADPVGAGFVQSLARPGGNATGFINFEYTMSGKWVELLKEIAPRVKRAAVLRDPTSAAGIGQFAAIQSVAQSLGIELAPFSVRDTDELDDVGARAEGNHLPEPRRGRRD